MRQKKYKLKCLEEIGKDKVRITFVLLALVATEIQNERFITEFPLWLGQFWYSESLYKVHIL